MVFVGWANLMQRGGGGAAWPGSPHITFRPLFSSLHRW